MFGSIQICRVFGIPIRVHVTLLILLPYLASRMAPGQGGSSMFIGLVSAVTLFTSVALHELGHSVVAMAKGYRVRDITLWPIGGVAMLTELPTKPMDEFLIAIAGPLVSLCLGLIGLFSGPIFLRMNLSGLGYVTTYVIGYINLALFLFNLVPAFPMDGGRVLRAALTVRYGRLDATRMAARLGRSIAMVYGVYSLFNGQILQALIALFIYNAAGTEYRLVQMQDAQRWSPVFDFFGQPIQRPTDAEITVSPPPYER